MGNMFFYLHLNTIRDLIPGFHGLRKISTVATMLTETITFLKTKLCD